MNNNEELKDMNIIYSYLQKANELYINKDYDNALIFLADCLAKSDKYYYECTLLKAKCLQGKNNLESALKILEEELSMPYIPTPFNDQFEELYDEIRKSMQASKKGYSPFDGLDDDELQEKILKTSDESTLILLINQLDRRNIRMFMKEVKSLLISSSSFIKTLLLEILMKQGINEEVKVIKNDLEYTLIPSSLSPVIDQEFMEKIMDKLYELNINKNAFIDEICQENLIRYIADIYPLTIDDNELDNLSKALYKEALISLNIPSEIEDNKFIQYYLDKLEELKGL